MTTTVASKPADPLLGTTLDGRYRIDALLGRGGMGRVYRAQHVGIARSVAVKLLDPRGGVGADDRQRFVREAIATGRLRHPNCVTVSDSGELPDGRLFLVMELVDGGTLDDVLDDQPRLPLPRVAHIARHILRGLAHAHEHGVVHRDLKPCNVALVPGDPEVAKVLDFGLARLLETGGADRVTRTGIVCGTPQYMAPEQCLGRDVDHRADLYALSVMLFEMLVGRAPFQAEESMQVLSMHVSAAVPRLAEVAPEVEVPAAFEALIRRGLAKRAEERPQTARDYLDELDRSLAPAPAPAPSPPPRRRVAHLGAVFAAFAAAAIGLAITRSGAARGGATVTAAAPSVEPAPSPPARAVVEPAAKPVGPELAAAMRLTGAGRLGEAIDRLRALRKARPGDAAVVTQLGHAYARRGWPRPALEAYRDAVRLDDASRTDPELAASVAAMLESRSLWQQASRFLERELGAAAIAPLTAIATGHRSGTVRTRAAHLLRQMSAERAARSGK